MTWSRRRKRMDTLIIPHGSSKCYIFLVMLLSFVGASCEGVVTCLPLDLVVQEFDNIITHFHQVSLEREVATIDEFDFGSGDVSLEGFGTRWNEDGVVLTPDREDGRFLLP